MHYLKDSTNKTIRALNLPKQKNIFFIYRLDTLRLEVSDNLNNLDKLKIPYQLIKEVNEIELLNSTPITIEAPKAHLTLVKESNEILKNVHLEQDNYKSFQIILKKVAITSTLVLGLLFLTSKLIKVDEKKETVEIVQVLDRQQVEKIITEVSDTKKIVRSIEPATQPKKIVQSVNSISKTKKTDKAQGLAKFLGQLNKSNQKGGLNLNQLNSSSGIGLGGKQGSGGMQTQYYGKGLFSSPLGAGHNPNGQGGYGTKGKGGGKAGYGQIELVGNGGSEGFIKSIESEAFVGGGLDKDEIAAVIKKHINEVRYCYETGLQKQPQLSGRVSVLFFIDKNGKVSTAKIDNSSLNHLQVESCIKDRLKKWDFPQPVGGVTVKVNYPFILRRVNET